MQKVSNGFASKKRRWIKKKKKKIISIYAIRSHKINNRFMVNYWRYITLFVYIGSLALVGAQNEKKLNKTKQKKNTWSWHFWMSFSWQLMGIFFFFSFGFLANCVKSFVYRNHIRQNMNKNDICSIAERKPCVARY